MSLRQRSALESNGGFGGRCALDAVFIAKESSASSGLSRARRAEIGESFPYRDPVRAESPEDGLVSACKVPSSRRDRPGSQPRLEQTMPAESASRGHRRVRWRSNRCVPRARLPMEAALRSESEKLRPVLVVHPNTGVRSWSALGRCRYKRCPMHCSHCVTIPCNNAGHRSRSPLQSKRAAPPARRAATAKSGVAGFFWFLLGERPNMGAGVD
jgi:hypothetical protein